MEFTCSVCSKKYKTKQSLYSHKNNCHPLDLNKLKCDFCGKVFAGKDTRLSHELNCREKLEQFTKNLKVKSMKKTMNIITTDSNGSRKYFKNIELFEEVSDQFNNIISSMKKFLEKKQTTSKTMDSYFSHVKMYFMFHQRRIKLNSYSEFSKHIVSNIGRFEEYLEWSNKKNYTASRKKNSCYALMAMMNSLLISSKHPNEKKHLQTILDFLTESAKNYRINADREGANNTSREALTLNGSWINLSELINIYKMKKKEIENLVDNFESHFDDATDFILLSMLINSPTLRTQNYKLRIYNQFQLSKDIEESGVFLDFEKQKVIMYLDDYKSQAKHGYIEKVLPTILSNEILQYYKTFHKKNKINGKIYLFQTLSKFETGKDLLKRLRRIANNNSFSISKMRCVMETAITESELFNQQEETILSELMLHDIEVAKKHYKKRTLEDKSKIGNELHERLISYYSNIPFSNNNNNNHHHDEDVNNSNDNNPNNIIPYDENNINNGYTNNYFNNNNNNNYNQNNNDDNSNNNKNETQNFIHSHCSYDCDNVSSNKDVYGMRNNFIVDSNFSNSQMRNNFCDFKTNNILTSFQSNYLPYEGDWGCIYCRNINFAYRKICKRCKRAK